MSLWKRLFGGTNPPQEHTPTPGRTATPKPAGWQINEKGFPTLESDGWRFVVSPYEGSTVQLWQYCAFRGGSVRFSHYSPSQDLTKRSAELHLKMGKMPPFGFVEMAPSEDEPFDIVGESNYQAELEGLAGPKAKEGANVLTSAFLMPEPDNPYDPNAVMVVIADKTVGYLSRDDNKEFLQFLERVRASSAFCNASIEGGWKNQRSEGSFCVRLDIAWPFEAAQH